ncbi:MAG: hypothetical protein ACO2PN_05380 [Pyrobaculum sp.]
MELRGVSVKYLVKKKIGKRLSAKGGSRGTKRKLEISTALRLFWAGSCGSSALLKRELTFAAVAGVFYVYIAAARLLYA